MKKIIGIIAVMIVCAAVLGSCFMTAFAENTSYELDELNMSIPVPNDMLTITRESEKTDSYFSKFSLDYKETMDTLVADDIYLQAMKEDSSLTLTVTMTKTTDSKEVDNYMKLSDDEISAVKDKLLEDNAYKSASIVDYNNVRYINLNMSTKMGKKIVQAQQYNTIINGENIVISMQAAAGEKFTTDDKELLASIIEGTQIIEQSFFVVYKNYFIYGGASLIGIIVVIVVLIFLIKYLKNPGRKHKHLVHELAHEHRISETTQIPRKHIFDVTKPTNTFMTNYNPVDEKGKPKRENPEASREIVSDTSYSVKKVSEPVIDEILAEADHEASLQHEKKIKRDSKPLPIKRVSDEVVIKDEDEEVPIAKPMIISEKEVDDAVEEALRHAYRDPDYEVKTEPDISPDVSAMVEAEPEFNEADILAEAKQLAAEELSEEIRPAAAQTEEAVPEAVQPESDEEFEQVEEYFEDIPEEEEMYSYADVDTAVDEYTAAKRESEQIRADRREVLDGLLGVLYAIGRGLAAAGRFLLKGLQAIGLFIVYLFVHIKYFCVNCFRAFKRNRAIKKRRRAEEERRRAESERRQAQREAERARRRQNANRGENDLVMVHSSAERRRPPQQRAPQGRPPQNRRRPPQNRTRSGAPQRNRNTSQRPPRDRRY